MEIAQDDKTRFLKYNYLAITYRVHDLNNKVVSFKH